MGFRQGGPAGFGLRRMLIDETGMQKGVLKRGQHKSLQTDRVILVPGPEHEQEMVRRIYHLFVEGGKTEREIAATLNEEGVRTDLNRPWTRSTIHQILTNEKYVGNNVYNRTSNKLKRKRTVNSPETWVRSEGAFDPLVPLSLFHMAQGIIRERSRKVSDEEMLERLKLLYQKFGYLSGIVIDECDEAPLSGAYRYRFGSLIRAYELIGFRPDRDYRYIEVNRQLRQLHPKIVLQVIQDIRKLGAQASSCKTTDLITINQEFSVSVVIARHFRTPAGTSRWKVRFDAGLRPDITVAVRMDKDNGGALDYYLLPRIDFGQTALRIADENGAALDTYRYDTLDYLLYVAERVSLYEVA